MSQKNHIWPAYVDMMTVLLLVYLIINAMYSALLANADLDPKPIKKITEKTQSGSSDSRSVEIMKEYQSLYNDESGDLVVKIDNDQYTLYSDDVNAISSWLDKQPNDNGHYEVSVFLHDNEDETSGTLLRKQTILYYQVLSVFKKNNVSLDLINNRNATPTKEYSNIIKIRRKKNDG